MKVLTWTSITKNERCDEMNTEAKYQHILKLVTLAGQIMLENGAETYRVEDTMERICSADNIRRVDTFVTPTGMFVCIETLDEQYLTTIKRVKTRITNLSKIYEVNNVSRKLVNKEITLQQALLELEKINNDPSADVLRSTFAAGFSSGFFALLLGGTLWDGMIALFCGAIIKLFDITASSIQISSYFLVNLIGGAFSALVAVIFSDIIPVGTIYGIIIGSIMPLVPGIAFTGAIRDMIYGDLVSGTARAVEALLIAIAIAAGVGIVLKIWYLVQGGMLL